MFHLIGMRPTIPDLPSGVFQGLINVESRCLCVVFFIFFGVHYYREGGRVRIYKCVGCA